jgi:septum formation protein
LSIFNKLKEKHFVLSSQSPRRQQIFNSLGLDHCIRPIEIDESFSSKLKAGEIPEYLAIQKAIPHQGKLADNEILITADTVVWINNHALNKPANLDEARDMLREISGTKHTVYTAVCLTTNSKQRSFIEGTDVYFHKLDDAEIDYYLSKYAPLDKAGAYGIQEFIGYIGIQKVDGDFYNVVGFPVQRFWKELSHFL